MKLLSKTEKQLDFELNELETQLLGLTLSAYPMADHAWATPGSSTDSPPQPAANSTSPDPELLHDALKELKEAHRSRLVTFLSGQGLEALSNGRSQLHLPREDVEWFLQVVNELRVASWYRLGCPPEEAEADLTARAELLPDLLRLDFAGLLLSVILSALEEGSA